MPLNLLNDSRFHSDLSEALKTITEDEVGAVSMDIANNKYQLSTDIIDLVKDSIFFKKLLVLTQKAFNSNDLKAANGIKTLFFQMAERRIRH